VAQLVDMGFSAWQARVAVDASSGTDLQEALDILVKNQNDHASSDDDDDLLKEEQWRKQQEERKKDYLDEMKYKTSPSVTPLKPTPYTPPAADPAAVYANNERKQGNFAFNQGQFHEAEKSYTLAIHALPVGHSDLILLLNNRAAAYMKQGKFTECLADCTSSIDIAQKSGQVMQAQLLKALHRKACAYEGLYKYEDAIRTYEEYIRVDGGSKSAQITQGIHRCQQAMTTSWKPKGNESAFPNIDISIFMTKPTLSQAEMDEINKSKAVKAMRDREKQKEAEETEKLLKEDQVDAQISTWKNGREKNLRSLLSSLELILWPGVQWKPVLVSDILDAKKCKITYMKAIAKVHPDKVNTKVK
jgi:tetratricopeptide (TPR) repeat protein